MYVILSPITIRQAPKWPKTVSSKLPNRATITVNKTMSQEIIRKYPRCIATISAGFEKGDFLVREEKGQRVYFDFFEEAFNYIAAKGYSRMLKGEEGEWMDLMVR